MFTPCILPLVSSKQSVLPERVISAAEARGLSVEELQDRLAANERYLRQIDHSTPQHVKDAHQRAEEAAEITLALELAANERQARLLTAQLEAFKQLQKEYVRAYRSVRLQVCV